MTPAGDWPSGTTTSSPVTTVTRLDGPEPGQIDGPYGTGSRSRWAGASWGSRGLAGTGSNSGESSWTDATVIGASPALVSSRRKVRWLSNRLERVAVAVSSTPVAPSPTGLPPSSPHATSSTNPTAAARANARLTGTGRTSP